MSSAIVFAYSEVGVRCLKVLLAQGVNIPLIFTHADDPNEARWFDSVYTLAKARAIRVETPDDPNTPEWLSIASVQRRPDFVFSFYYRYMLKPQWLDLPAKGAMNMHGSLLPKYRGRAPVHWAILNGETQTGVSLHYMLPKPDAGAVIDQQAVPILPNDDALMVSHKIAAAAEVVLARSLPGLIDGSATSRALDLTQGSYFGRRRPEDGRIDWRQSAQAIHNLVRAVAPPFPGAFTDIRGVRLAIHETRVETQPPDLAGAAPILYAENGTWYANCADGGRLRILKMQVDGRTLAHGEIPPVLAAQPVALN